MPFTPFGNGLALEVSRKVAWARKRTAGEWATAVGRRLTLCPRIVQPPDAPCPAPLPAEYIDAPGNRGENQSEVVDCANDTTSR